MSDKFKENIEMNHQVKELGLRQRCSLFYYDLHKRPGTLFW